MKRQTAWDGQEDEDEAEDRSLTGFVWTEKNIWGLVHET